MSLDKLELQFSRTDLWIGVRWNIKGLGKDLYGNPSVKQYDVWICLLPMLLLHIQWRKWSKYLIGKG